MEKQSHQEYRDKLAKDLKEIDDDEERRESLELEKEFRYEKSTREHHKDIQEYLRFRENLDRAEKDLCDFQFEVLGIKPFKDQ